MESVLAFLGFSYSTSANIAPKKFFGNFFAHLHDHFIPHPRNNYHPHIFGNRLTTLFSMLLVVVKIFSLSYLSFGPALPVFSSAITSENVFNLTNQSRTSFGLKSLTQNPVLSQAAQFKADDMAKKGYFSHTSPDGRLPWSFIQGAGYNYIMAGENLAVNFFEAESMSQAWMNSESHKANILNKNFEEIGIGIAEGQYGGKTSIFVVQMFGVPAEQNIVLKSEPTVVQFQSVPQLEPNKNPGLQIAGVRTEIRGGSLAVSVETNEVAVKVLAIYGHRAVWLYPKAGGNLWQSDILLGKLAEAESKLSIKAFGMSGEVREKPVMAFAPSVLANYDFSGKSSAKVHKVFGQSFNLQNFQYRFYLFFVAGILASLCLAIAIRKHIQHISLVANGSFVAILAILLWMG
ncbi:MAG: hypothetical protein HYZ51_02760 [Candidatus Doudnabacteria bacterium]|nr:hypothetical protein [Candidatus Doudnabacteria bacterium]